MYLFPSISSLLVSVVFPLLHDSSRGFPQSQHEHSKYFQATVRLGSEVSSSVRRASISQPISQRPTTAEWVFRHKSTGSTCTCGRETECRPRLSIFSSFVYPPREWLEYNPSTHRCVDPSVLRTVCPQKEQGETSFFSSSFQARQCVHLSNHVSRELR